MFSTQVQSSRVKCQSHTERANVAVLYAEFSQIKIFWLPVFRDEPLNIPQV